METKSKLDTVKTVTRTVVAFSVQSVVYTIIQTHTPADSKTKMVKRFIGAYILGAMVADATEPFVNNKIDKIAKRVRKFLDTEPVTE